MREIITPLEHPERIHGARLSERAMNFAGDYMALHFADGGTVLVRAGVDLEVLAEVPQALSCVIWHRLGLIDDTDLEAMKAGEKRRLARLEVERERITAGFCMRRLIEAREKLDALGGAEC